jgi:hypothetical protein
MTEVKKKVWWQSKTILAGIATVALVAYSEASNIFGLPPVPDYIYAVLGALGVYGRVTAKAEVGK